MLRHGVVAFVKTQFISLFPLYFPSLLFRLGLARTFCFCLFCCWLFFVASSPHKAYNADSTGNHAFGQKPGFNGPPAPISIAGIMPGLAGGLAQYTTPAAAAPGYPLGLMQAQHDHSRLSKLSLASSSQDFWQRW